MVKINKIYREITPIPVHKKITQSPFYRKGQIALSNSTDEFISTTALSEKRSTLNQFFASKNQTYTPRDKEFIPNANQLGHFTVEDLIARCSNNLAQIKHLYGEYGLAHWATLNPSKIIKNKNSNIKEVAYAADRTISDAFNNYMLHNTSGSMSELFSRFGKSGEAMFVDFSSQGYLRTGIDTYKITTLGEKHILDLYKF